MGYFDEKLKEMTTDELREIITVKRNNYTPEALKTFVDEFKDRTGTDEISKIEDLIQKSKTDKPINNYSLGLAETMKIIAVLYTIALFLLITITFTQILGNNVEGLLLGVVIGLFFGGLSYFICYICIKFYENVAQIGINTEKTNRILEKLYKDKL